MRCVSGKVARRWTEKKKDARVSNVSPCTQTDDHESMQTRYSWVVRLEGEALVRGLVYFVARQRFR